jgi:hypothetical protein
VVPILNNNSIHQFHNALGIDICLYAKSAAALPANSKYFVYNPSLSSVLLFLKTYHEAKHLRKLEKKC